MVFTPKTGKKPCFLKAEGQGKIIFQFSSKRLPVVFCDGQTTRNFAFFQKSRGNPAFQKALYVREFDHPPSRTDFPKEIAIMRKLRLKNEALPASILGKEAANYALRHGHWTERQRNLRVAPPAKMQTACLTYEMENARLEA